MHDTIGYLATFVSIVSFVPQIYKTILSKQTRDISLATFCLLITGGALWVTYGFMILSFPVIVTNSIIGGLCLIIVIYKIRNILKGKEKPA